MAYTHTDLSGFSSITPGEVLLGILGGVISDKKCKFSQPFSDLASKILCHRYLDKNSNKTYFLTSISNSHRHLSLFLTHLEHGR